MGFEPWRKALGDSRGLFAAWSTHIGPETRVGALEIRPLTCDFDGAGDRTRTGDPHLGKVTGHNSLTCGPL
jgi:hypothetical protein